MAYKRISPMPVIEGGTGNLTLTDHGIMLGSGTAAVTVTAAPTDGQLLIGSTGVDPVLGSLTSTGGTVTITPGAGTINLESGAAVPVQVDTDSGSAIPALGILEALGGEMLNTTGAGNTVTIHMDRGTNGQIPIAATGAPTAYASLTSTGGTIAFTPGANSLNLEATVPGSMFWNEVLGTSQAMAVENGYVANNVALVTLTLPAIAAFGQRVYVAGKGSGGWAIAQNAGQTIHFGNVNTTTGAGGSLASTNRYDNIELLCITANTDWVVLNTQGNVTYV